MISSSRTSHRVSTKACTDVSLFCISNNKKLFVYFGANRKDVINLTTTTKKNKDMKEAFYLFFASCHAKRESQSRTRKKESRKIERRIFLLSRILGRDFASSSAFKREKEIFLQPQRETKKLDSSDLSLSHIIISSLISSLAFSVVVTQNAPLS